MSLYIIQYRRPNGGWRECGRAVDWHTARRILAWRMDDGYQLRWLVDGRNLPLPARGDLDE